MAVRPPKSDPYSAFKDDRQRLWALISRDVRLVAISACLATLTTEHERWTHLLRWFGFAA
jgi:hypothetical protein